MRKELQLTKELISEMRNFFAFLEHPLYDPLLSLYFTLNKAYFFPKERTQFCQASLRELTDLEAFIRLLCDLGELEYTHLRKMSYLIEELRGSLLCATK